MFAMPCSTVKKAVTLLILMVSAFAITEPARAALTDCRSSAYACTPGYTGDNTSTTWAWKYYGGSWAATPTGTHNCTLYAAWRLAKAGFPDPGRTWGNASDWGVHLASLTNKTPALGAVAWFNWGHVGIVDGIDGGNVLITSDNYATSGGYTASGWIPAANVTGFIHLRGAGTPSGGTNSFSTAFEANTNNLWNVDGGGIGDLRLGMMPGTSPSVAKLCRRRLPDRLSRQYRQPVDHRNGRHT